MIERKRRDKDKLYVCFLDIEKAYDRVIREIMWCVLVKIGLSEKIVNIIRSMYEDTKAIYRLGTLETDWVRSERGVRQGCTLSPTLFSLYTEEMAARLRRMDVGVKFGDHKINVLLYADDVVIMSETGEELQALLNVVDGYGRDFGVKFSSEKSKVMIVNRSEDERNMTWRLSGNELKQVCEYKYLGVWLSADGCERAKNEKISGARQWVGRLGSVARMRASKYDVLREVWKSVAVPNTMYGMDVIAWNENELDKLEVCQNKVARMALNAPRYAAVEALRGDMGWSTFRERLAKAVLRYRVRLHRMDENRWAKKVFEWNIYGRWMKDSIKTEMWAGELGMLVRGVMRQGSMDACKRELNNKVEEKGRNEWKCKMSGKSTLEWYRGKDRPGYESCYDGSYGSDLLFKARTKSLELNSRVYRWTNGGSKTCIVCESGEDETIEHMITECDRYVDARARMLNIVKEQIGVEE